MKNNKLMTPREEDLMNVFWNQEEPMAITDIIELLDKEQWNQVTLFRIVKKLLDKGYLEIYGFKKNNTQYARKFIPSLTKEEYAAVLLSERGIESNSLANIALAMLGGNKRKEVCEEEKNYLIHELENIIEQIKKQGE